MINQWAGVEGIKCETEKMMTEMMTNMTDTESLNKTMTGASCITTGDQVLEVRGFDKVCIYFRTFRKGAKGEYYQEACVMLF